MKTLATSAPTPSLQPLVCPLVALKVAIESHLPCIAILDTVYTPTPHPTTVAKQK